MVCSDYLFTTAFIRKIKTKYGTYLAEVRSVRVDGRVRQQFIRYIGKSRAVRRVVINDVRVMEVRRSLDIEVVHRISEKLGINGMIPKNSMVMLYPQLLDRPSINGMEEYL